MNEMRVAGMALAAYFVSSPERRLSKGKGPKV